MGETPDDREIRQRMARIDALLQEVEKSADPRSKERTREIVQCLMDMHGAVLERMLDRAAASQVGGPALIESFARDDLIGSLLILYGLHPLDLETRVREALESVKPYLQSHGGNVELTGIDDGVVRLRLHGSCHGCPSSAATLKNTIEEAICQRAPDVSSIVVEGEAAAPPVRDEKRGRVELPIMSA